MTQASQRKRILVAGAGLAGLTAAYQLQRNGHDVVVLEASDAVGGHAETVRQGKYEFCTAATILSDVYVEYLALAAEVGIAAQIERTRPEIGTVRGGKVHYLNSEKLILSGLQTKLLSWKSKFVLSKALVDVVRAKARGQLAFTDIYKAASLDTETATEYGNRRLNEEIRDYICDPIVRAMVVKNSSEISKVEVLSGLSNIFGVKTYGLRGGAATLPKKLAEYVEVRRNCEVKSVTERDEGIIACWSEDGAVHSAHFDGCVIACPLPFAAEICPHVDAIRQFARVIEYSQIITVAVGMKVAPSSPAAVLQIPKVEHDGICLFLLNHNIMNSAAPQGHGVVVALWDADKSAAFMDQDDAHLINETVEYLARLFPETRGTVDMTFLRRWKAGLPLSRVGAYSAMARYNEALDEVSLTQFCGDYMGAIGQETAVSQGNRAARRLCKALARD